MQKMTVKAIAPACRKFFLPRTLPTAFQSAARKFSAEVEVSPLEQKICQTVVKHPITILDSFVSPEEKQESQRIGTNAKFAVIELSGTQFKVAVDDVVVSNLIHNYDIGESVVIKDVLLMGSQNETVVGRPTVRGAVVTLEVEEITKDKKVIIFKKKRRKQYKRKTGFRRDVTILRVTDIKLE